MKTAHLHILFLVTLIPATGLMVSCSTPATATSDELPQLFGFLGSDNENRAKKPERQRPETRSEREQTERLQEIADRPTSRRPDRGRNAEPSENPLEKLTSPREEKKKVAAADTPPAAKPLRAGNRAWDRDELRSSRISIGDIFSEKEGMRINKSASINDALDEKSKKGFFSSITKTESYKVPLTISQEELAELKQKSNKGSSLPTRSVALDFESNKKSAKPEDLEVLFGKLTSGAVPELRENGEAGEKLNKRLTETKERLAKGEKLYVVTGVTGSDKLSADYPGAPVGSRDAEPIKNAVETMFPQLDELEAAQSGEKVEIKRDPELYWGFEARELKLENDQIVIERDSSIQH